MSGGFNLDDYNTVPERMAEAVAKYPEGRFQSEIVPLPAAFADKFVAVKARYFRTPDDPTPGEGLAWELVPGKTPYTKDSELQNAETSAWGRALIAAFAADAKKGIASQEEVRNRQATPETRRRTKAPEKPPEASQTPVSSESGGEVKRLKNWLLKEAADVDLAKRLWRDTLAAYGLGPADSPSTDMLPSVENDLQIALKEAGESEQKTLAVE